MKEIYMQYPYDKKNVFYDGKMHKIYPKKLYILNNQYYILIYDDLKTDISNMVTILEKVENSNEIKFRKVPLSDYSNLYKCMKKYNLKEQNLDIIKSDITEVTEVQDFNNIIAKIKRDDEQRMRAQVAVAPAPPTPPTPPNPPKPSNPKTNVRKLRVRTSIQANNPIKPNDEFNFSVNNQDYQQKRIELYISYSFIKGTDDIEINGIFYHKENFEYEKIIEEDYDCFLNIDFLKAHLKCCNSVSNVLCNNCSIDIISANCENEIDRLLTRMNDVIKINVPVGTKETPQNAFILAYKKVYNIVYSIKEDYFIKRLKK